MSCCSSYPSCGCGGTVVLLSQQQCAGTDPGMEVFGRHLLVMDSQFNIRRVQNAVGYFVGRIDGSGRFELGFTTAPVVEVTTLELNDGDSVSHLLAAIGEGGNQRRIFPAVAAEGFLKADNGSWKLVSQEDVENGFVVPDPLTLTTLNVTNLNATTPVVSGTPTFSGLSTDSITQIIGLNASNQLVKGTSQTISIARYYENPDLTSAATPNYAPASPSSNAIVGNEISDADSIASPVNQETIKIDKAGSYKIEWGANFQGFKPGAANATRRDVGIWLLVNNSVVSYGNAKTITQDDYRGGIITGTHIVDLAVNDQIRLQFFNVRTANSNVNGDIGSGVNGVNLTLTKYK